MAAPASNDSESAYQRIALTILVTAAMATAVLFAAAKIGSNSLIGFFDYAHWTVAFTAAALVAWLGVRKASEQDDQARRWFAYGLTSNAVAQIIWDTAEFLQWDPFPAPSDLFFVATGACFTVGMLATLRTQPVAVISKTLLLDIGSLALVVLTLTLDLYLPRRSELTASQLALLIAYPIFLLTPSCIGAVLAPSLRWKMDYRWLLFLVACIVNGGLWMHWNALTISNSLEGASWLNLSFSVVTLVMGYGAYCWHTEALTEPKWERHCERVLRLIPLVVVGAAVISIVLVWALPHVLRSVQLATCIGAMMVIGFAVARQNLSLLEHDRIIEAEQRARESERRLSAVFQTIRDGVAMLDAEGRFINVNSAWRQMLNYSADELIGKRVEFIDAGSSVPGLLENLHLARANGGGLFEVECRAKDGGVIHTEVSANVAADGNGLIATFRNVTERKRAEERLRSLAQRLSLATSAANMGIWDFDYTAGNVVWDERMHELYGMRPHTFGGTVAEWQKCVHPEDQSSIDELLERGTARPGYSGGKFRIVWPDGQVRHIQTQGLAQFENGKLRRVTGVNLDISDVKATEEQLRAAARDLSLATEAALLAVSTWHVEENRLVCDDRMYQLYGFVPSGMPPTIEELKSRIHPDDLPVTSALLTDAIAGRGDFANEYRIVLPSGETRWIEARLSTQFAGSKLIRMTGLHWDITSRKQAEFERLQLEAQLRQAQKLEAIGTLAGGIAHDFNNILGAILGNADMAREDLDVHHPAQASVVEIRKASQRGKELVQRLLAFGRPQDQRRERLHLHLVVEEAIKLLRPTLPATVELTFDLDPNAPLVLIDAAQISQVIINLCMNAYQAMEDQKGRINIKVGSCEVTAENQTLPATLGVGPYTCLSVEDNGSGMSAETMDHAFEAFFTTKSPGQGSGLGLAVVHGIVRAHTGVISIGSLPGKGTRFDIYLPSLPPTTAADLPLDSGDTLPVRGRGQRILYLDDEESLVFLARRLLDRMGYNTSGYTEAAEAIEAFRNHPTHYDIVITDLSMPGMSGIDVAKELLSIDPNAMIVLVSGYVRSQDVEEARAAGIREVVSKPNTVEELTTVVHKLLSQRRNSAAVSDDL